MIRHTLKVGKSIYLRKNYFKSTVALYYAGMPSDSVYSLVYNYSSGYHSMALNLFYPKSQTEIEIRNSRLQILQVTP
jgi:hypothetical protein